MSWKKMLESCKEPADDLRDFKSLQHDPTADNDDDNLIMGFAVDKASLHEKFEVTVGVEQKELSPYCILMCLTLDGKLLMFYLADDTDNSDSPKMASVISDEEDDSLEAIPLTCNSSRTSSRFEGHAVEETVLHVKSPKTSKVEFEGKGSAVILNKHELQMDDLKDSSRTRLLDDSHNKKMNNNFSMSFSSIGENQDSLQSLTAKNALRTPSDLQPAIERQQNAMLGPQSLVGRQSSNLEKSSEKLPTSIGSSKTSFCFIWCFRDQLFYCEYSKQLQAKIEGFIW